jgi:hypothetical protein
MGQRNPKNQLKTVVVLPMISLGFQPPFWWCRISQPSTVWPKIVAFYRPEIPLMILNHLSRIS